MAMIHRVVACGVLFLCGGLAFAAEDSPDHQKLILNFKEVQRVLLTVNSEIMRYEEQFQELSTRLHQSRAWNRSSLEGTELVPLLKKINEIKIPFSLIGSGLDSKYSQLKAFQMELKERYPLYTADI